MEQALEEVEVLNEVKVINAVLKNKDKSALFGPSVDDLFTAYGDVWGSIKEYHEKYGDLPHFDVIKEKYPDLEDVEVKAKTEFYVEGLRTEFIDQRVENLLIKAGEARRQGISSKEIKERLQTALGKLDRFSSTGRDLAVMDTEEAKRHYEEMRDRAASMGGTPGVPTGVNFIDACMPLGMQPGDVMSIIGYPGRGKSSLGTLFASHSIRRGFKPLIFTLEMSAEAVRDRIYTVMGSGLFSNTDLMLGNVNNDDFREFSNKYGGFPGEIVDGNGAGEMTPNFIRGKFDQHRPDYILMDYLQLFHDNRLTDEMTPRMRNLSMEIKAAANACQIPFVVISSATPPDGGRVDGPPNVERSAWSRQLAYDSTVSFAVHRHEDTNYYQVEAAKNRYGPLFSGFLDWDIDRGTYEEKFDLD